MRNVLNAAAAIALAAAVVGAPVERPATDAGTIYGGAVAGQDWGRPLAVGDLDGDGYDEVIVGASESWGGVLSRVYVLRGGPGRHALGSVDLSLTPADQVILGAAIDDNLGCSMAAGDVNGDGVDDLLLCASTADYSGISDRGIAYLIFGGPSFFDLSTRDLAVTANWDLRILGPVAAGDMGGANLFGGLDAHGAAIGRLNNDQYGDIALGVHLANGAATQSGRVYVVFGGPLPSGFTLNLAVSSNYGVRIDGKGTYDELGTCVLTADLTGDGIEELILGNEYYSRGLFTSEGAVHIFRGRATWPTSISLASTTADITLWGARAQDELGVAVAAGDFNGDGLCDVAAAAPGGELGTHNTQQGDGLVYGLFGTTAWQTGTYLLNFATATPAFMMVGEYQEGLGAELGAADFNADGVCDLAAAQRFGGPQTNGTVEVVYGRAFAAGETFTAGLDTDLRIIGNAQDRIGFSLAAADVNGDGLAEVVFGTPFNNGDRGTAYVFTHASGDGDHDGDVDLADFALMQHCAAQPPAGACALFDFGLDEDLGVDDLEALSGVWQGPA